MKTIQIPKKIYQDFLDLLDSAQCQFTEEELKDMTPNQIELLNFISSLIGENATKRFKSIRQQKQALRLSSAESLYP